MSLEVNRKSIRDCLALAKRGEWQVPRFQREFVWSMGQVYDLLHSIFASRPIGLITLWAQPQGAPHTAAEPLSLKTAEFRGFDQDPAVMKLILDGRQRLTALAMAFGGLHEEDQRRTFSGRWFLDLDADRQLENFIIYKKRTEVIREHLTSMANCLAAAKIPLDEYERLDDYYGQVNNRDFYPADGVPDAETRDARMQQLAQFKRAFEEFQVPIAELPDTVSLAQVCDIFDVLNTTGTKVSTFDLIHNLNFAETTGRFELRTHFENYSEEQPYLSSILDPGRPEFLCQVVTGCYLSENATVGRNGQPVRSIKGGDLLNTPTSFYETFHQNIARVDSYCSDLFGRDVLGTQFRLNELAYPVSSTIYLSLRWALERSIPEAERFSQQQLNRVFRAFYWSNCLTGRYDQGFLTLYSSDLSALRRILVEYRDLDDAAWSNVVDEQLALLLGEQYPRVGVDDASRLLLDGEIRGALRQAVLMLLAASVSSDLVSGDPLDRTSEDKSKKVQFHHLFPKQWCADNRGQVHELQENNALVNCFANLLPMTAESNNGWKTRSPSTAMGDFDISQESRGEILAASFIDDAAMEALLADSPVMFWERRAHLMAEKLVSLQFAGRP